MGTTQCFDSHCGSLRHGGSGSWVKVWWWIVFGVCDGGCFVICDLVARFLFCDGCFLVVVASGRLILGWGLRWWQVGG